MVQKLKLDQYCTFHRDCLNDGNTCHKNIRSWLKLDLYCTFHGDCLNDENACYKTKIIV